LSIIKFTPRISKVYPQGVNLPRLRTPALIEYECRISGHTQKSEDIETIPEKLTLNSILTECFIAVVVAGLWPV